MTGVLLADEAEEVAIRRCLMPTALRREQAARVIGLCQRNSA